VGLVQYEIEKAGFTTITLSNVPEFTAATCVPRIAAIERPFGRIVSDPGEKEFQLAVLRGVLQAIVEIKTPGEVIHLPFTWTGEKVTDADIAPPPISIYLRKHIRQVFWFIRRDIPEEFKVG
jgi:D-proline reductase (dithiol) PrdB